MRGNEGSVMLVEYSSNTVGAPRFSAADKSKNSAITPSSLTSKLLSILDRTEYRLIDRGEDLEAIYALRYDAYRRSGMVHDSPSQSVSDDLDDLPNCYRFGIYIDGELASTIRFHYLSKEHPHSTAMAFYSDILGPRLERGETFIDPGRFAADQEMGRLYPVLPYISLRIPVMATWHFNATYCLSLIQEHHVAFYQRVFDSSPVTEPRQASGTVVCVAQLFQSSRELNFGPTLDRYPFFRSTATERRMLFDRPSIGADAPLTVLPTARLIQNAA